MGRTSVPNSSLSTPRNEPPPIIIDIYGDEYTYSLRQYKNKTECVFVSLFVCFVFVLFFVGGVISPKTIFNVLKLD